MKPKNRNTRLINISIVAIVVTGAVYLVSSALKQSISYFYSPTEVVQNVASAQKTSFGEKKISLGGMVEEGSVKRGEGLQISFRVTDFENSIIVEYDKVLPDLFREGQGVVAEGHLNAQGVFIASRILAKHDENYMPPAAERAMKPS